MFTLRKAERIDAADIPNPILRHLHAYWTAQRRDRAMPGRRDLDLLEVRDNIGRMHVLDVEGPGQFRYRLYGGRVTNPDRAEMTGRTTMDYEDKGFARMVTDHLQECVDAKAPLCYRIDGTVDGHPYRYIRLVLPLSDDGATVSNLLVGTQRIEVNPTLERRTNRLDSLMAALAVGAAAAGL